MKVRVRRALGSLKCTKRATIKTRPGVCRMQLIVRFLKQKGQQCHQLLQRVKKVITGQDPGFPKVAKQTAWLAKT